MRTLSKLFLSVSINLAMTMFLGLFLISPKVLSQTVESNASIDQLDDLLVLDSRSSSLSGASSIFVNDLSSLYLNPSGLSYSVFSKSNDDRLIRELRFPRLGSSTAKGSTPLKYDVQGSELTETPKDGRSIDGAIEGYSQYARLSVSPLGLFIGNVGLIVVLDEQASASPSSESQDDIAYTYRGFSGIVVGSSFDLEPFTVGVSRTIGNLQSVNTIVPSNIAIDVEARKKYLNDQSNKSKIDRYQFGISKTFVPSVNFRGSVVLRDHDFKNKEEEGTWLAGVGIAPHLGNWARLAMSVEMHSINKPHIDMNKKPRASAEFDVIKGQGNFSVLSLRTGYSSAGLCYGAGLNVGLIKVEVASEMKEVGALSNSELQRRTSAILSIDVASPP